MPHESEGLRIARERIAMEREKRTGVLDLGKLGLQNWPEELWELEYLTELNLGDGWYENEVWHKAEFNFDPNQAPPEGARWASFPKLKRLYVNGMAWTDLSPLRGLNSLQALDCSDNKITTLEPLSGLVSLQSLHCYTNELTTLEPLARLTSLQFLRCSGNHLTTLEPLKGLTFLRSLNCFRNQLTTLEPLAGLTSLQSLDCSHNRLTTLEPLTGLTSLQSLNCSRNQLTTLEPLTGLTSLQSLNCSRNQLTVLEPLLGLSRLEYLDCSGNLLTTLDPLKELTSLRSLNCFDNTLATLEPLAGLSLLESLDCSGNPVATLEPMVGNTSLQHLDCWNNPIKNLPEELVFLPSLVRLIIFSTALAYIPTETLSQHGRDNCLQRLRAHLQDLKKGEALLSDVKIMILGNGRTGKTQICNHLRDLPFERNADSTHGITVSSQQFGPDTLLRLWDFGGQDIYHGTHALFIQSSAVFVLVWTLKSENRKTHDYLGITFNNRPLAWWLSCVRHLAKSETPVLLVQNWCDQPQDRKLVLPVDARELDAFPFCQMLQYSAFNRRGEKALKEALEEAVRLLQERQEQVKIGIGRVAVKNRLEALLAEDRTASNSSARRHRILSMERYEEICAECGGVSSPAQLLEYLHLSGVVLHRPGLFGDRIILDQHWALEAVYSVFSRDGCLQRLRQFNGRMTRALLEDLVWHDHSEEEQRIFLDLMLSCGICFIHCLGNDARGLETEYIAPDLLPDYTAVSHEVEARWGERANSPYNEAIMELPFSHPGVMRTLLSRIGNLAGMAPVYWRDGICLYESTCKSHALIEQRLDDDPPRIVIRTCNGRSLTLLEKLAQWVREAAEYSGLREVRVLFPQFGFPDRKSSPELIFNAMPANVVTYAVSYSWRDKSHETVDRLCREAEARGIRILRDVTDVGLGEKLSRFMTSLAGQDRVFVILSDAYLRSENCMFELSEIWRLCQQDDSRFHERVRMFRMPDAKIHDLKYQVRIVKYWSQQQERVRKELSSLMESGLLAGPMLRRFNNLKIFAQHAGEIVPGIADRLLPKDFEKFAAHGFADAAPNP